MFSTQNPSVAFALQELIEGNLRFRNGVRSVRSLSSRQRLEHLAQVGQKPFAIVVSCSDSRIPTEMIFDQGIGDLFVVRIAGNVIPPSALASIEYALQSFDCALCLVVGHTQCGAVQAAHHAWLSKTPMESMSPNLRDLLGRIIPSVQKGIEMMSPNETQEEAARLRFATEENVKRTIEVAVQESALIRARVEAGTFGMFGSVFEMHSGEVKIVAPKSATTVWVPRQGGSGAQSVASTSEVLQ